MSDVKVTETENGGTRIEMGNPGPGTPVEEVGLDPAPGAPYPSLRRRISAGEMLELIHDPRLDANRQRCVDRMAQLNPPPGAIPFLALAIAELEHGIMRTLFDYDVDAVNALIRERDPNLRENVQAKLQGFRDQQAEHLTRLKEVARKAVEEAFPGATVTEMPGLGIGVTLPDDVAPDPTLH